MFVAAVMSLAIASYGASTSFAAKTIKIGVLSPLTGLYSIVGKRTSQGINMAVKEINDAGGVLGHKFEALIRDSETNPASSVRTARRLILRDKVFALLGPLHGGAAIAVLQESKKLKTMNFPWAATEEINTKFCSRYTWRVGSSAQQTSRAGAVIAHRLGLKKWATISSDFSYGRSVVRQFWNYLKERDPGAKRPYAAWPKLGENDYSAYINKMQKAKPDAIFVGLFGADLIKFMKQARSFGMYEKVKIFTDFGGNHVVLKALGDQAPFGHWASSRYLHNYPVSAGNKRFVDNFRKAYNVYPDMTAGEAYSTVHVIAESIRRAGAVDKEKAIDAMGGVAFNSPEGWIIMRPSDHQGWQSSFWGVISKSKKYPFPILSNIQVISPVEGSHPDESTGQGCRK
ncbi:MAG: ABC transporter substrate-binding protein [Nitrospinae bacterium]|nr:ABC transporter substrate-binding protein [Nitrospinota bacterium]